MKALLPFLSLCLLSVSAWAQVPGLQEGDRIRLVSSTEQLRNMTDVKVVELRGGDWVLVEHDVPARQAGGAIAPTKQKSWVNFHHVVYFTKIEK